MKLCLDVGNSQMHGGVYRDEQLVCQFRRETTKASRDELGLFLVAVLREQGVDPTRIERIGISCVVPAQVHALRNACRIYFEREPLFVEAGIRTRIRIRTRNPLEVGADRIANAVAATLHLSGGNVLVVDFGTALTIDAVSGRGEYLGGVIAPGLGLAMDALGTKTAKLPLVEILRPERVLGRSTIESIQSGLYYGYAGLIASLTERLRAEAFGADDCRIIATGGFAQLYRQAGLFDEIVPDLVLRGVAALLDFNPVAEDTDGGLDA